MLIKLFLAVDTENLTIRKSIDSEDVGNPDVCTNGRIYFAKSSDGLPMVTNLDLKEDITTKKPDSIAKENLTCNSSQDERGPEHSVVKGSSVKRKMSRNISTTSVVVINALYYKVSIILAMCCITGCYLMPVVLYYITQQSEGGVGEDSHGKAANVHYKLSILVYSHAYCIIL